MRSHIDNRISCGLDAMYKEEPSEEINEMIIQLNQYFKHKRTVFNVPLKLVGTAFQQQVWKALQTVPYGETISYLDLSKKINNEKAIRAVASANGANAISIIIPCHRIIGSNRKLVGYAGGVNVKKQLLNLEKKEYLPKQLSLFK